MYTYPGTSGFQFAIFHSLISFYQIWGWYPLLRSVLYCVYSYNDTWEVKHQLGFVRLSEIDAKIVIL